MFGKAYKLFRVFGFTVRIDLSWLVIALLVTFGVSYQFTRTYPGWPTWVYWAMGLGTAAGLFFSIVWHELAHSIVARQYGLNMRGITLFIFGGVSEMPEEPGSPKAEFLMAVAGPLSSVVLAGLFWGVGVVTARAGAEGVWLVLQWLAILNVILAIFNMLPGFPLDGGRVLRAGLWAWRKDLRWATRMASYAGQGFALLMIGLGVFWLLGGLLNGLWFILLGWFLFGAARSSYQQLLLRQTLEGEPVSRFMTSDVVTVPPEATVAELVDNYVYRYHHKLFPVVDGGHLEGCVTTREVQQIPRDRWSQHRVQEVVRACGDENTVHAGEDAMRVLSKMNRNRVSRVMVTEGDHLVGVVSLKDLLKFFSLKMELEDENVARHISAAGQG